MIDTIKMVSVEDEANFTHCFVGCIVLTHDNKIVLQRRGIDWKSFPDKLATFGGRIEANESPLQALIRELDEELGGKVKKRDVIKLGAITELYTQYSELVHIYFWHDKQGTITGCYEGEAQYFDNVKVVLGHSKAMDDVRWALGECQRRNLLD